jgi:hypothetical protein
LLCLASASERIKIKNQESPQILRMDAKESLQMTQRNREFIRIFYDYSCTFASIRGQFENAEEECPQGEGFLRNAARTLRARAPVIRGGNLVQRHKR